MSPSGEGATPAVIQVGMSPCPNDTFMFHALMHGLVPLPGEGPGDVGPTVRLQPVMLDIEELNLRAVGSDPLPVTKLSVPALGQVLDRYQILDAGAALGRGVGPLVVQRGGGGALAAGSGECVVAVPGSLTTAFLLLRIFEPQVLGERRLRPVVLRFDQIIDAVAAGKVEAGVIIHESRFTYRGHGLELVCDLGLVWEADTDLPLPLGVIAAHRDLGATTVRELGRALRRSVELALADPAASRPWIRQHAQEMDDSVCDQHIALYVNDHSVDLGAEGRAAVSAMLARERAAGVWRAEEQ